MGKNKKLNILKYAKKYRLNLKNSEVTDIYSDISLCKIEALFNREVIIEGCKNVKEYSNERISVGVNKGLITVDGVRLNLYSFDNEIAIIRGKISSININS